MKVASLTSSVLLAASAVSASSKIAVYELSGNQNHEISESPTVSIKNSILYLADKLGAGDFYSIGHKDKAVDFIELVHEKKSQNPELLVVLKGVDTPEQIHQDWTPSFQIETHKKDRNVQGLLKTLVKKLPKQIAESQGRSGVTRLSDEISYVPSKQVGDDLDQQFKYFGMRLPQAWSDFVDRSSAKFEGNQQVVAVSNSGLKLVNDKLYISELMHMVKLASCDNKTAEFVVANFDSLHSIGSRIGYNSRTYSVAKGALLESLTALKSRFDITLVAVGTDHRIASDASKLAKRHNELDDEFSTFAKRGAIASKSCFSDEDACVDSTNKCNGHGACTKVQAKCWQCVCAPTFDKKTSKTTKWAGYDCGKKDIAAQAHLLLWTSVALLATLVGGLKLLYSVGNVELPGVLQAATIDTSR